MSTLLHRASIATGVNLSESNPELEARAAFFDKGVRSRWHRHPSPQIILVLSGVGLLGIDYAGLSPEEAQGEGWVQYLHPEDRQRVRSAWQRAVQTGGVYETEQRLRRGTTGA